MTSILSPESTARLIQQRRTIHAFTPEAIPDGLIEDAIALARWAPNHRHTEPWRFHLIGPETKIRIIDLNATLVSRAKGPEAAEAKRLKWNQVPGWLCVTCFQAENPIQRLEDYAACCCAIQNMALYLWSRGFGFKWTTGPVTRTPEFFEILKISSDLESVVGLCWYGRAAKVPEQSRRDLSEFTHQHD